MQQPPIVLHLVVIGFHPRSGYRVEFCYPPIDENSAEQIEEGATEGLPLPAEWDNLKYLAMPDGAHNFESDSIYFTLRGREGSAYHTVFGISCYRQINVNRATASKHGEDGLRGSIQKSVCLLSTLPLFGVLESKLEWVTRAFFDDVQKLENGEVECGKQSRQHNYHMLKTCYEHIAMMVKGNSETLYEELPISRLVADHGSKILILFKLLLLEKRVLFFGAQARPVGQLMISLVSLLPEMLLLGMFFCGTDSFKEPADCSINLSDFGIDPTDYEHIEPSDIPNYELKTKTPLTHSPNAETDQAAAAGSGIVRDSSNTSSFEDVIAPPEQVPPHDIPAVGATTGDVPRSYTIDKIRSVISTISPAEPVVPNPPDEIAVDDGFEVVDPVAEAALHNPLPTKANGFPLSIFTKGYAFLPYASLQLMRKLEDHRLRGFMIGATNELFKTRRSLVDAVVELTGADGGQLLLDLRSPELKRQLHLSTEDIRFINGVQATARHYFRKECVEWEGGEQCVRLAFSIYLISLLLNVTRGDARETSRFCSAFCRQYTSTVNYRTWRLAQHHFAAKTFVSHPGCGDYTMQDLAQRWTHLTESSEQLRRMSSAVGTTSKTVGEAVEVARSSLSSALSSLFKAAAAPVPARGRTPGDTAE